MTRLSNVDVRLKVVVDQEPSPCHVDDPASTSGDAVVWKWRLSHMEQWTLADKDTFSFIICVSRMREFFPNSVSL